MSRAFRSPAVLLAILTFTASALPASAGVVNLNPNKDNTIFSELTSNSNGAGDGIYSGRINTGGLRRALIAFDLSAIPTSAVVTSATLTLNMSQTVSGAQSVGLHRATASWGEGTSVGSGQGAPATTNDATWLRRFFNTISWTTNGGDFAGAASATQSVNAVGNYVWSGAGLEADVQAWINTPANNFGWVVIGNEITNGSAKKFDSRQSANPPVLHVVYSTSLPGTSSPGLALLMLALIGVSIPFLKRVRLA